MATPKPEQDLQNEGRLCIGSLPFVRLYRNNVGVLNDRKGTPVSYGLAVGSADTIGLVAPHGRFLSIEWKRPGWTPPTIPDPMKPNAAQRRHMDQLAWRAQINAMGGVAGFASSLEDGVSLVWWARSGMPMGQLLDLELDSRRCDYVTQIVAEFRERMNERDNRKRK